MTYFFILLFTFFVFWRPQDWLWPWMSGWNILDVLILCSAGSLLAEVKSGAAHIRQHKLQFGLLFGLFFAGLMSHIVNGYFAGVINTFNELWKICFVTALMFIVLDRPSRLRGMARIFVVMACIMAVHALMQDRTGSGFLGAKPLYIPETPLKPAQTRTLFFGIFSDPNDLAQILGTSIPFAFLIFKRKSFLTTLIGCGLVWLLVEAILTTHSRGGMTAMVAVFAVMIVLVLPARWLPFMMIVLIVAALAACPLSAAYMDASAQERISFWGDANRAFKSDPFFGIGYGMMWTVASGKVAHNAFVSCYTELGIFGYWFWFNLLILAFWGAWRARIALAFAVTQEQKWMRRCAGLSVAALAGFLMSSYFLSRTFVYPMFFLFAMLVSMPLIVRKILPEDRPVRLYSFSKDCWRWGSIGAFLSIFYIYYSILLLNMARGG